MTETVSIDDSLTCYGVHWNVSVYEARAQFAAWGFTCIQNFKKLEVLNGNAARTKARDIAIRKDARYFWVGDYDVGVGDDSAIYQFTYDAYTGDSRETGETAKHWAGYVGEE